MFRQQQYPRPGVIALTVLAVLAGAHAGAQQRQQNFRVAIEGAAIASANAESITVEDLVIDEREMTTGADWDYRVSGPGDAHFGSITIRARVTSRHDELHQWWLDCSRGKNIRKSISIIALNHNGAPAREWNFHSAFPVRWDPGEYSPSSNVVVPPAPGSVVTIECVYEDLDMWVLEESDGRKEDPGNVHLLVVDDAGGKAADTGWEGWSGGGVVHIDESHLADAQFHTTTPGHKYIDTLTLRGPLTSGRKALCQWITETVKGQPWKRTVTVKEVLKDGSDGKTFTYHDCFPTRYVFPAFDAHGGGNLYEEIHIKPIRIELA